MTFYAYIFAAIFLFIWRLTYKLIHILFPVYDKINLIAFDRLFKFEQWLLLNFYSPNNFLNFYSNFVHDIGFIPTYRELRLNELNIYPAIIENEVKNFIDNEYRYDFSYLTIYKYYRNINILNNLMNKFSKKYFKFEKFKFLHFVMFQLLIEKALISDFVYNNPTKINSYSFFEFQIKNLKEIKNLKKKKVLILMPDLLKFKNVSYFNKFDKATNYDKFKNNKEFKKEFEKAEKIRLWRFKKYYYTMRVFYIKLFKESNIFKPLVKDYHEVDLYISNRPEILEINSEFQNSLDDTYPVRYSETSVNKHLDVYFDNQKIYFLRKNRIFNKSRYSRNRQLYRTGVYWCLWFNILMVYGLFFFFYRFSFNFGYLWWGLCIFAFSFIIGKVLKYRFYNLKILLNEFYLFFVWVYNIFNLPYILSLFNNLIKLFK